MIGFLLFVLVGYAWKKAAGKARGMGSVLWALIIGCILVLVCNFAHFYAYDNYLYPYKTAEFRAKTHNKWVKEYNDEIADYRQYLLQNFGGRSTEFQTLKKEKKDYFKLSGTQKEDGNYFSVERFNKDYVNAYNEWVSEYNDKILPDYNVWAKENNRTLFVAKEKLSIPPMTFEEIKTTFPDYMKTIVKRWQLRQSQASNAKVILGVSWFLWILGIIWGALWIPKRAYVHVIPPSAPKKAADKTGKDAAKKEEDKDKAEDKKDDKDKDKKPDDKKPEEKKEEKPEEKKEEEKK